MFQVAISTWFTSRNEVSAAFYCGCTRETMLPLLATVLARAAVQTDTIVPELFLSPQSDLKTMQSYSLKNKTEQSKTSFAFERATNFKF